MLPYILAAVGGYLIGDSLKGKQYAERGYLERGGKVYSDKEILEIVDEDEKYFGKLTPEQIKKIEDSGFDYDDEREGWVVMKNFNEAPYGDDGDLGIQE